MNWQHLNWQDCEQLYHCKATANECIRLQDEHGLNVNLLLLAMYLDANNWQLSANNWQQLINQINPWYRQCVDPMRAVRRQAKSKVTQQQYQHLLQSELILERQAQLLLTDLLLQMHLEKCSKATNLDIITGNIEHSLSCSST